MNSKIFLLVFSLNSLNFQKVLCVLFNKIINKSLFLWSFKQYKMQNNSIYLIPNAYIPILIKKSLFKNHEKAVKSVDNCFIPSYALDSLKVNCIKKTPNAFILFRGEKFKTVKMNNTDCSSREISKIIGNMWSEMSEENKLPYKQKANEIKLKRAPICQYKKFFNNLKRRNYKIHKEQISSIKKLLFNTKFIKNH
jgi:hypothetical protein